MDRPEICPKDVYEIMKSCWAKSPYDRPLFAHIVEGLSNVMKQNVPSVRRLERFYYTYNHRHSERFRLLQYNRAVIQNVSIKSLPVQPCFFSMRRTRQGTRKCLFCSQYYAMINHQ